MSKYSYDETGAYFNYFLLSVLALVLFPSTFSYLYPKKEKTSAWEYQCPFDQKKTKYLADKQKKKASKLSVRKVAFIGAWILFAFITYKVAVTKIEEYFWDPYEIIGVSTSATTAEIKRAFRKLSLQYHPDKVEPSKKDEAEKKFVELSKAYKVLTDEDARSVFEEWGHPDGKQSFAAGIALPQWLVEGKNSAFVLLVYAVAFGIGLPMWVANWWNQSKNMTKDKILHDTMALFYRELKENLSVKQVIELISVAKEFESVTLNDPELVEQVNKLYQEKMFSAERIEKSKKFPNCPWGAATRVLIYAHVFRIPVKDVDSLAFVSEKAVHLLSGLIQISLSHQWLNMTVLLIETSQRLVQALSQHQSAVFQLPFITEQVFRHLNTKKRSINSPREVASMNQEERRSLFRSLSDTEYSSLVNVANQLPILYLEKAYFSVLGDQVITPSSIVTLTVRMKMISAKEFLEAKLPATLTMKPAGIEKHEEVGPQDKKQWWNSDQSKQVYCPLFLAPKRGTVWILMCNAKENRLITMTKADIEDDFFETKLQFQAPPQPGKWVFQVFVKTDSYVGLDQLVDIPLVVSPADSIPLEPEEDDISEAESDTLQGMMNKAKQGQFDDSDSSSDESDEDQFNNNDGFIE